MLTLCDRTQALALQRNGSVVLGGITVGPAVLIGGFVLAGEGEKALSKAREYEAQVNVAIGFVAALCAIAKIDAQK